MPTFVNYGRKKFCIVDTRAFFDVVVHVALKIKKSFIKSAKQRVQLYKMGFYVPWLSKTSLDDAITRFGCI